MGLLATPMNFTLDIPAPVRHTHSQNVGGMVCGEIPQRVFGLFYLMKHPDVHLF